MIKIFVHEISRAFEGKHDRDKEYYTPIETRIHIYSNKKYLDFSDIRYWKILEELKVSIGHYHRDFDHYGYTGDFDENNYRERADKVLAKEICEKLNHVTKGNYFEVYELEPYKVTQCRAWDKNFYYNPKDSECCYDITKLFLGHPDVDERYKTYLKQDGHDGYTLIQEQEMVSNIQNLRVQIIEIEKKLNKLKEECDRFDKRRNTFCRFIAKEIDKTHLVNDVIDIEPSYSLIRCYFNGKDGYKFYPLNVALELQDKKMINKLIENGAYKLAQGFFEDTRNKVRGRFNHSYYILLKYYCDNEHCKILRNMIQEQSAWNDEFDSLFQYLQIDN